MTDPDKPDERAEIERWMEKGNRGGGTARDPYFFLNYHFQEIIHSLDAADGNIDAETKEKVAKEWDGFARAELRKVESNFGLYYRQKSSYPYEGREPESWFSTHIEGVEVALEKQWKSPEVVAFLESVREDLLWGQAMYQMNSGYSVNLPQYFDKLAQTEVIRNQNRLDPTGETFQLALEANPPGFRKTHFHEGLLPPEFDRGLRGMAIKRQDDVDFWTRAVAAVSQMEIDENGDYSTFMKKEKVVGGVVQRQGNRAVMEETLTPAQVKFIEYVFGERDENGDVVWTNYNGRETAAKIMNFYATSDNSVDSTHLNLALMKNLASMDMRRVFESLGPNPGDDVIKGWADEVLNSSREDVVAWYTVPGELDDLLAQATVDSQIVRDWGQFAAGDYGWRYTYKDGRRNSETGPNFRATDIVFARMWRKYLAATHSRNWTSSQVMPIMSDEYMKKLDDRPPDWLSDLSPDDQLADLMARDPVFKGSWEKLMSRNPDPHFKRFLIDNMWLYGTATKDANGNYIGLPMFLPPEIKSLDYYHAITATERGRVQGKLDIANDQITEESDTVGDQLEAGMALSEIDWGNTDINATTRYETTVQQIGRVTTAITEPGSDRGYWADLLKDPDSAPWEFLKRLSLAYRDEKIPPEMFALAFIPMMIALKEAGAQDLLSTYKGGKEDYRGLFRAKMGVWMATFDKMSNEIKGVTNFSGTMVAMTEFYYIHLMRLADRSGKENLNRLQNMNGMLLKAEDIPGIRSKGGDPLDYVK